MSILYVCPNDIEGLWQELGALVTSALRNTPTHDANDVKTILIDHSAHLFIQYADRVEGIAVVEILTFPKGKWLNLWLVAALPDIPLQTDAIYDMLDEFRKYHGCRGFQAGSARLGWGKRLGLELEGYSFRKTID